MEIDNKSVRSGNYHTLTIVTPVATGKEPHDYNLLINKPRLNGIELVGDVSLEQIGLADLGEVITEFGEIQASFEEMSAKIENVPTNTLTQEELDDIVGE
jgi:hypothetical protein